MWEISADRGVRCSKGSRGTWGRTSCSGIVVESCGGSEGGSVFLDTSNSFDISSFVRPFDSRNAIFLSVGASRISSSCKNFEACSSIAGLDGGGASLDKFSDFSSGLGWGSVGSSA